MVVLLLWGFVIVLSVPPVRQLRAIRKLEAKGYRISFDAPGTPNSSQLPAPLRRYSWINQCYLTLQSATGRVTGAHLCDKPIEDSDFDSLRAIRFDRKVYFDFQQSQLNNRHMKRLEEFPELEYLDLRRTRLRDVGLVHLRPLKNLKWLNAGSTRITDAGIDEIIKLQELEVLWLDHTDVTTAGALKLKALPKLRSLHHSCTDPKAVSAALPKCQIWCSATNRR
jgi:Leucine-rich repeat (LRR) protein